MTLQLLPLAQIAANGDMIVDTANANTLAIVAQNSGAFLGNTITMPLVLVANSGGTGNVGIDFTDNQLIKARIAVQMNGSGSWMNFGTSNNYNSGITNKGIVIDPSGNVFVANISVNSISSVPVFSNATVPNLWNKNGAGAFQYWKDPFGIVHLRGSLAVNTAQGNVAVLAAASNVANGLPIPFAAENFCSLIQVTTGANGVVQMSLRTNGAMQISESSITSGNINFVGFSGMTYSTLG